jgi:EAL domain-containing protein (putative c-di-GMP-specific phosphodiesterase class I)
VLVVEDESLVAASFARMLRGLASGVSIANDAESALQLLDRDEYDVVVSDIQMPGMSGTDLLRAVRARDLDLPVIFATGEASVESAAAAVEHGAFRYLTKPVAAEVLRQAVEKAAKLRALTRQKAGAGADGRAELEPALRRAIASLTMAYQPIVSAERKAAIGCEALMRSTEPTLRSPPAVIDAAEKLGALHMLGRRCRNVVASDLDRTRATATTFVNLHSADLADSDLYDPQAPLSRHAGRIVLEITERASLEGVADLDSRLHALRGLGYRIAVDDLGAGYAGLHYFARIKPELVKIDMSLVRGVDADAVKQRVVLSLVSLASGLGMEVVAEGVETVAERDTVIRLGSTYVQGYNLAKPGPPFPTVTWKEAPGGDGTTDAADRGPGGPREEREHAPSRGRREGARRQDQEERRPAPRERAHAGRRLREGARGPRAEGGREGRRAHQGPRPGGVRRGEEGRRRGGRQRAHGGRGQGQGARGPRAAGLEQAELSEAIRRERAPARAWGLGQPTSWWTQRRRAWRTTR